jgi:hypothetical protein
VIARVVDKRITSTVKSPTVEARVVTEPPPAIVAEVPSHQAHVVEGISSVTVLTGPYAPVLAVTGTSESVVTISTGAHVFELDNPYNALNPGMRVRAAYAGDVTRWLEGEIVARVGKTITVAVDLVDGSGEYEDWILNLTGEPGIRGVDGIQGPPGTPGGPPGPIGPEGPAGPAGPTGPQGAASTVPGPTGPPGATGPAGSTGAQGVKGDKGDTGNTGAQGPQGATGATGPAGADSTVPGPTGPAGVVSATAPLSLVSGTLSINLSAYSTTSQIAATYQPLDADLTALAAIGTTGLFYRSAANTWSAVTFTAPVAFTAGAISVDLSTYAPKASPALTGTPTAPTVTPSTDSTTTVATTAFVQAAIAAAAAGAAFSTGDVKLTLKTVADAGWIFFNDGTIGSATSGASFNSNTTQALFLLLFANINDTNCPIQTSTGAATTRAAQGTAAAAWSANCRMLLPKMLGRALAAAGSGAGLSSWTLGQIGGAETFTPTAANSYAHYHQPAVSGNFWVYLGGGYTLTVPYGGGITDTTTSFTSTVGSSAPFGIQQPTTFLNVMVKL